MCRAEYDKMAVDNRVQASRAAGGKDMTWGTSLPDPDGFKNYKSGDVFAEFEVKRGYVIRQGNYDMRSVIIYGGNSRYAQVYPQIFKRPFNLSTMPQWRTLNITRVAP